MPRRDDMLVAQIKSMQRMLDADENFVDADANVIQDLFFPVSEKLKLSDTTEVSTYTYANFVWGDGGATNAGWYWGYGGTWKSG